MDVGWCTLITETGVLDLCVVRFDLQFVDFGLCLFCLCCLLCCFFGNCVLCINSVVVYFGRIGVGLDKFLVRLVVFELVVC